LNTKTKVKNLQTEHGIKDKFQTHFIQQLFDSYKDKKGKAAKQAALDAKISGLPKVTLSPVWRIKGLPTGFSVFEFINE
jgi:sulfur relay (sulfurtransferase) DsrC/TusE family protein